MYSGFGYDKYNPNWGVGGGGFGQAEPSPYNFNNWWNAYLQASFKGFTAGLFNFQQQYFNPESWENGKLTIKYHYFTQSSEKYNNEFVRVSTKHFGSIILDLSKKNELGRNPVGRRGGNAEGQGSIQGFIPDVINVNLSIDFCALFGGGVRPVSLSIITNGPEAGLYYNGGINAHIGSPAAARLYCVGSKKEKKLVERIGMPHDAIVRQHGSGGIFFNPTLLNYILSFYRDCIPIDVAIVKKNIFNFRK